MRDRYEGIECAHKNNFKWIFHEAGHWNKPWDGFAQWLKARDGIYWVSGKAGSGKSTLMRYIIDNPLTKTYLQNWSKDSNQLMITSFFFWTSGAPDQSSQLGLFRSLLFGLLSSRRHLIKFSLPELWEELATSIDPVEAPKLVDELVMKSDGVFLWVTLVVKSLLNGLTNGDRISFLRRRLKKIPSKIESLYRYMLIQIEPLYHEEGWQLFSIASLAFHDQGLYSGDGIDAVHMSLAIDEGTELILSGQIRFLTRKEVTRRVQWINIRLKVSCTGLLELNQWSSDVTLSEFGNLKVQYIHRTARDFLDTLDAQKTPMGKFRSTKYHVPTRLLKANDAYIKSCFKLSSRHSDPLTLLTPIIERTM